MKTRSKSRKSTEELYVHTRRHMMDRYEQPLSREQFTAMNTAIQTGQAVKLEQQSGSRSIWRVPFGNSTVIAAYNHQLSSVTSVLSEWMFTMNYQEGLYVA